MARRLFPVVAVAALGASCGRGDGLPAPCPRCNLIIVDLGEVRMDRLGLGGAPDDPMPTLSALAARGLSFEAAQGVANWWGPAQTAVATGLAPWVSEVMYTPKDPKPSVAPGLPVMAAALAARGWETAGVVGWALPGTSYGFDRFMADKGAGLREATGWLPELASADRYLLVARASLGQGLMWNGQTVSLRSLRDGTLTAEEYRQAYDDRLRAMDAELAALMAALTDSGQAGRTWVLVIGEHGGTYGDLAGEPWLAEAVTSDAVARVPLVWVGPKVPRGSVSYPVSVLDVLHTALAELESDLPPELTAGDLRAGPPSWVGIWSARGGVETRFGEPAKAPSAGVAPSRWFEEVAAARGIAAAGATAGLAWGDANGDHRPDLWVGNHGEAGALWVGSGDRFVDGSAWIDAEQRRYDDHGAAWADLDGDGDDDLIELVGAQGGKGVGSNRVWVNEGAVARDRAAALGLDLPMERGRSPLWVDLDGDGWLDLVATAHARRDMASGTAFMVRSGQSYVATSALPRVNATMAVVVDVVGDEAPEVVVAGPRFPELIVTPRTLTTVPWEGRRAVAVRDVLAGDLDGDGREDVVLLQTEEGDAVEVVDARTAEAAVRVDGEAALWITATGRTCVEVQPWMWSQAPVFLGAASATSGAAAGERCFEPDAPEVQGLPTLPSDGAAAVGLGRSEDGRWVVGLVGAAAGQVTVRVTADGGVGSAEIRRAAEPPAKRRALGSLVWRRGEQGLEPWAEPVLASVSSCASGALADFDNDMDLDLYLGCTGGVVNTTNLVLENVGGGRFVRRVDAAAGVPDGRTGEVAAADFDGDGFVDLAIVNGHGSRPFNDGPVQLLRNVGNGNHWLEVELVDAPGDRRAVGAVVWVDAGGQRQVRVSDGGAHRWAQDHDLLHIGLGPNVRADLEVRWPDGQRTTVSGVAADQVVRVGRGGLVE